MGRLRIVSLLAFSIGAFAQLSFAQASGLNFAPPVTYYAGALSAISLTVSDVNGDGIPDIVVANGCASPSGCGSGTVSVLLGRGNGTFGSPVTYSSGSDNATSVAVADVNGDGRPDIVTSSSTPCDANPCNVGTVGILLGNGDGTFQAAVTYSSGGILPLSVAVADVNADGIPDVVVANACFLVDLNGRCYAQGSLGVLLGNGDGSFKPVVTYPAGPGQLSMNVGQLFTNSVVVADVNGDGKPDIVASNFCIGVESQCDSGDGYAAVLLGNGDGTFKSAVTYDSGGFGASSLTVQDVNRDGKPDIVVANRCDTNCAGFTYGPLSVLLGNGDGTFQPAVTYNPGGGGATTVTVADVNGDGKPDLIAANEANNVAVLLGNGNGTFQCAITFSAGGTQPVSVTAADVNGDGKPDILVTTTYLTSSNLVSVLINTSTTPALTTLTSSLNPSHFGQAVTFFATVPSQGKGTPTGTVTFICGGTKLGVSTLDSSGVATLTTSKLPVGSHRVKATYSGDANLSPSTSPVLVQTVQGAVAVLSTTSLNFGNQAVGTTSAAQTVTLKNTGNIDLALSPITLTGTNPFNFGQTGNCGPSLGPNASCTISVKFKPLSAGGRTAAVSVSDNAPNSPQKVWLSGTGVQP